MTKIVKLNIPGSENEWENSERAYGKLVKDSTKDSAYLRSNGLQKTLIRLIGDASEQKLLDIGCGDGWLVDMVQANESYECDIVRHQDHPIERNYEYADLS